MSSRHRPSVITCEQHQALASGCASARDFAILEELSFVRREAQAEANLAYEDWRELRSRDAYAVYRAAQDRADAAQDYLAVATDRIAA
jgi:hypothetical protein